MSKPSWSTAFVAGLTVAVLMVVPLAPALAHAFPDHSVPAVGSTIAQAPTEVQIWFTQKLEPAFSTIEVLDANGARVDQDDAKVDAQDPALLRVSLKPLVPGTYKVVWHVVSVDTHPTAGDFSFAVTG
jgi:methionine-rich copper-binding protein CopC